MSTSLLLLARTALCCLLVAPFPATARTTDGKPLILMIAGRPSHGPGEHEHNAGVLLLAKCLAKSHPQIAIKTHLSGEWPSAETFSRADTILIYSDGGGGHPAIQGDRLAQLKKEMDRGAGLVCIHYAVEVPKEKGGSEFLDWLGGYFEMHWSVNPHWKADYKEFPKHPVANGVKPFSAQDEWYYHMRFRAGMKGIVPVLTDLPPADSLKRPDGPHSGNPDVRRAVLEEKQPQHTAWASERENGGRGFGFTGGHFHRGWANDDQRKLVLNAILWTAKVEVPADGVQSTVTPEDMEANLDPKQPRKPRPAPSTTAKPDAKALFSSGIVRGEPVEIKADLAGAKELYLVTTDGGDGYECDWAVWLEPQLIKADGTKIKLTDLQPKSATVGWGGAHINQRPDGSGPIKVKGVEAAFGLAAHAPSSIGFDLPPGIAGFTARGAIEDGGTSQGGGATAVFRVYAENPDSQNAIKDAAAAASALPEYVRERYGIEKARASISSFTTADGLSASLFAAEPLIQNPTNIDIDHRGRVWAVEAVNYRSTFKPWKILREAGDRVVILEDTNSDGEADKETVFWQSKDLQAPLGICVLPREKGTHVIVSAAPNIWLLTDTDGDDRADQARILFKVGGNWDHDHEVHSFVFGHDGKFYFNFGNEGRKLMWPDGSTVKDLAGHEITDEGKPYRQGMIFRCDIDLEAAKASNVETLGHNFRNNYELAVDSFGTMWQSDNDDDGNQAVRINYVMEYGNYGFTDEMTGAGWRTRRTNLESEIPLQHWHQNDPGSIPNLLQTGGGSPTGLLINESGALGAAFTNQIIHCDAGPRTVRAYPAEKDGAGYRATMVDLLTSTDTWYRPADIAIAPDGSLYVADWYDPGVGGHNMADHTPGKIMGRIYRVAAKGAKPSVPTTEVSTIEGAIAALQSPNSAIRYIGWQALHRQGSKAEPALAELAKSPDPRKRARALNLLVQIQGRENRYLTQALTDPDSDVRVLGVRLALMLSTSRGFDTSPLEENRELMGKLMRDPSPQVRRQIAIALHRAKDIEKLWAALAMQHDGKDRWYLEALGIGAAGNENVCFDAWLGQVGDKWNTPAGRDIIWRMRSAKAADYLAKIIADPAIAPAEKPRYLRAFDFLPASPERTGALTTLATAGQLAGDLTREALVRLKGTAAQADPAVATALQGALDKARGTPQFIALVRDFGMKDQADALLETALKFASDPVAGDAVQLLLADPKAGQLLDQALASDKSAQVIQLLGTTATKQGIQKLLGLLADSQGKAEIRHEAVRALARTQAGAAELVKLAEAGNFPEDLRLTASSALALVQYPNLGSGIAKHFPPPGGLGGKSLPPISELVKLKGDIGRGKTLAERAESSCVTCHRIGDVGVEFGPGLSEIGSKLGKEALFESIINPNAGVSMGFETWQFTLRDGGGALGIVRSETQDEVVLALPGGAATRIARSNIAKREKLPASLMPSALNLALSQQDLIDLVEYLSSLKAKQ
jgi:putative membrane-bound dehydrogenase-like protein